MKIKNKRIVLTCVMILCSFLLFGCSYIHQFVNNYTVNTEETESKSIEIVTLSEPINSSIETDIVETTIVDEATVVDETTTSVISNSFVIPEYNGDAYVYINNNEPFFTVDEYTTEAYYYCSPLDTLGRAGMAMMCANISLCPNEKRGDISMVKPTGWKQNKYEFIDDDYIYNRCHLLAYSLTGIGKENEDVDLLKKDLITGTRYLNIDGMWAIEETVLYYVKENPNNHCMYRVTPIYEGNNLLASGVLMEGCSVEDNGVGVKFCVYCFNVQPGITIDYKTGENWK